MSDISLYPFQKRACKEVEDSWGRGNRSVLISVPTGGGKTVIFSSILKSKLDAARGRGLVLVHRDALLTQAIEKLNSVWPGVRTGRVQAGTYDYSKQITVASVQTLMGKLEDFELACKRYGPPRVVVCDEAHHAYAPSWQKIIKFLRERYNPLVLGVTATPLRTNRKESLTEIFEDIPYSISIFQLIQEGFLSSLTGYSITTNLDLEGVRISHGDYSEKDLFKRIRQSNFNRKVVQVWAKKASRRKTICFAVNIDHVETLTEEFRRAGAKVAGIHGKLPRDEQRKILQRYSNGDYNVLVNCQILTEGFDEPAVDCVLMARPTSSRGLYVQMVGRGLRLFPGKKDCLLVDFTDNARKHTMITMQDLLSFYGLKRAAELYKNKKELTTDRADRGDEPFVISPATVPVISEVERIGGEVITSPALKEIDVFDINKFSWNTIDNNLFVTVRENLSIAILESKSEDSRKKYIPNLVCTGKETRWIAPLSGPVDRDFALAVANVYLFDYGNRNLAERGALWRKESFTLPQKKTLESLVRWYNRSVPGKSINIRAIPKTRGHYSDMINSLCILKCIVGDTRKIDRDMAISLIREMILNENASKNQAVSRTENSVKQFSEHGSQDGVDAVKLAGLLNVSGSYSDNDIHLLNAVLKSLKDTSYGDFPHKFLLLNPKKFEDSSMNLYHQRYPRSPLNDRQRAFLVGKITRIFRLYFRNKSFNIIEESQKGCITSLQERRDNVQKD